MVSRESSDEPRLLRCEREADGCGGAWLNFDDHLAWVNTASAHRSAKPSETPEPVASEAADEGRAKRCPRCGRLLTRYRVSADHEFRLDRCASCAGIWFDAGEWELMKRVTPLARLQHLFNDTSQQRLAAELRRRQHEDRCRLILGEAAFGRVIEFRAWMRTQPHAATILALLDDPPGA